MLSFCALSGHAVAGESRPAAVHQVKDGTWIGCDSQKRFDKVMSYLGDKAAFRKAATSAMAAGECTMFRGGETVCLVGVKMFGGVVKVRRDGDVDEYWTNMEAVK
ncbi:hypothetical protein GNZ13_50645 [Paraburkholderia sp. 5N]|uniref:Uncharacterized protein n=2 Tax=Paraburkholderia elongata TaxID=2675747 RepID=A0A972SPM5_9BURK|nr:hypothetical protein [Paraburkholderia elongata]